MVRLIVSIVFFIILAVFIAFNAKYTTTISLYGHVLEEVSAVTVVIVSMAVGVLYSFALYLSNFIAKWRADRIKKAKQLNKQKAEELKDRKKALEASQDTEADAQKQVSAPDDMPEILPANRAAAPKPGVLKRLFGGSQRSGSKNR